MSVEYNKYCATEIQYIHHLKLPGRLVPTQHKPASAMNHEIADPSPNTFLYVSMADKRKPLQQTVSVLKDKNITAYRECGRKAPCILQLGIKDELQLHYPLTLPTVPRDSGTGGLRWASGSTGNKIPRAPSTASHYCR
jgi:hypothetical protein